jgi:hypothetical protein
MTQNLIETVAQEMHGNRYEWPLPEFAEHREEYRTMAKAAVLATLEGIREPSARMTQEAERYLDSEGHLSAWEAKEVWQDMIDALRAEIESAA